MAGLKGVAPEIVACISEGREATPDEVARIVDRMSLEIGGARPAISWGVVDVDSSEQLIRGAARLALNGNPAEVR